MSTTEDARDDVTVDWPTPATRFVAAVVLGVASLGGLGLALARVGTPAAAQGSSSTLVARDEAGAGRNPPEATGLDLNAASKAELEMLPGVGPALADRIIAERDANGPFKSIDDLDRVKGIGPKTLERLRGMLRVAPPAGVR